MTRLALAAGATAAIFAIGGSALAARGFSDVAGDVNTAPDVTGLEIAETTAGTLTIGLTIGNFDALPPESWINLWFDTDSNQDTGADGDEALVRHSSGGGLEVYRWSGSELVEAPTTGVTATFAGGVLSATIPRTAIGASAPFGVLAVTARGQAVGDEQLVASDFAPDAGRLAYGGGESVRAADPAGDHDAAPDITAVRVSDAPGGWITFDVTTPNYAQLPEESAVVISVDADSNPRTGDDGAEIQLALAAGQIAMERWDGRQWLPDDLPTRARFRNSANRVSIDLHVSELRNTARFRFSLLTADVNTAIQGVVAVDVAPDDFSYWSYTLANRPRLTLAGKALVATPPSPRAGRRFTVALGVVRSDTGRPLASGSIECRVRVAGKRVAARGSVGGGAARCTVLVPRSAKGKPLRGTMTVRSGAARLTRAFVYVVG